MTADIVHQKTFCVDGLNHMRMPVLRIIDVVFIESDTDVVVQVKTSPKKKSARQRQ